MASRSVWTGFIRFALVSIPCKAFAAAVSDSGAIKLNQLHAGCGAQIKSLRSCPEHGVLASEDIVLGYQFAKDKYVVIDPADVAKLRTRSDKTIDIEAFIDPHQLDGRYFTGRTMYLVPDGPIAKKPYALLRTLLAEGGQVAFATAVMSNREQLLVLRAVGGLVAASFVSYDSELKPLAEFLPDVPADDGEVSGREYNLAVHLAKCLTPKNFDLAGYTDGYRAALEQLVQTKVDGREVVTAPAEAEPAVINLLEALQQSVAAAKARAGSGSKTPPKAGPRPRTKR